MLNTPVILWALAHTIRIPPFMYFIRDFRFTDGFVIRGSACLAA
jgi:hypothetical protein